MNAFFAVGLVLFLAAPMEPPSTGPDQSALWESLPALQLSLSPSLRESPGRYHFWPQTEWRATARTFITSGRAGFVLTSTLYGSWLLGTLSGNVYPLNVSPVQRPIPMMNHPPAVAAGAIGGMGISFFAAVLLPDISDGDLALFRNAMWIGVFHGDLARNSDPWQDSATVHSLGIDPRFAAIGLAPVLLAALATPFWDPPPGGVALATSAWVWTGVSSALLFFSLAPPQTYSLLGNSNAGALLATGVADVALLGMLIAAPLVPVTRVETWALDIGAFVGLLSGCLYTGWSPHGRPTLGETLGEPTEATPPFTVDYWVIAGTTAIGAGIGYLTGHLLRRMLETHGYSPPPLDIGVMPAVFYDPTENPNTKAPPVGGALSARW